MTTYSTTADCALAAGIYNVGAYSRPSQTQIDLFRKLAYRQIGIWVGYGAADVNGYGETLEIQMITRAIEGFLGKGPAMVWALDQYEINDLQAAFNVPSGMTFAFEPGAST